MEFYDSTNKDGLLTDVMAWCFGSSSNDDLTAYPLADKTRNINAWYDRVVGLIMQADNNWQWDDANQTDLPVATTALVANQQDYGLNAAVQYKILKVEILDSSGDGHPLDPIDYDDKKGIAMTEYKETAGTPKEYDLVANSIYLYPKPDYAKALGLRIYFQRGASYFVSTDTTKVPGFAEPFHRILSYGASLDWLSINHSGSPRIPLLEKRIKELEAAIIDFYSTRHKGKKIRMTLRKTNYGQENDYGNRYYSDNTLP